MSSFFKKKITSAHSFSFTLFFCTFCLLKNVYFLYSENKKLFGNIYLRSGLITELLKFCVFVYTYSYIYLYVYLYIYLSFSDLSFPDELLKLLLSRLCQCLLAFTDVSIITMSLLSPGGLTGLFLSRWHDWWHGLNKLEGGEAIALSLHQQM